MKPRLIAAAAVCLTGANMLPAFWCDGRLWFGLVVSILEFLVVAAPDHGNGLRQAAALGVAANLGFLVAFIALGLRQNRLAMRSAVVATASAFGSVLYLATGDEKFVPYPGCLLWLATGPLLALGTKTPPPSGPTPPAAGPE